MSDTFHRILDLIAVNEIRVSAHGYEELAADQILFRDVLDGATTAIVVENYPDYHKRPCGLVLQRDSDGPIHVLWGIPSGASSPAVLITAYRPNVDRWSSDFQRRIE